MARSARTTASGSRISVSSPLLDGYDEPEILRSSSRYFSLTGADVGHGRVDASATRPDHSQILARPCHRPPRPPAWRQEQASRSCNKSHRQAGVKVVLRWRYFFPPHAATMLHGLAGSNREALIMHSNISQHTRHEKGRCDCRPDARSTEEIRVFCW